VARPRGGTVQTPAAQATLVPPSPGNAGPAWPRPVRMWGAEQGSARPATPGTAAQGSGRSPTALPAPQQRIPGPEEAGSWAREGRASRHSPSGRRRLPVAAQPPTPLPQAPSTRGTAWRARTAFAPLRRIKISSRTLPVSRAHTQRLSSGSNGQGWARRPTRSPPLRSAGLRRMRGALRPARFARAHLAPRPLAWLRPREAPPRQGPPRSGPAGDSRVPSCPRS
jgi:hypothetical protein